MLLTRGALRRHGLWYSVCLSVCLSVCMCILSLYSPDAIAALHVFILWIASTQQYVFDKIHMGTTWEKCVRAGVLWDLVYIPANLLSIPNIVFRCQVIVL